ncbi:ferredoxin [Candidatus Falkowbacteria bacterium]|nr:ferredoxin [Candidatus Falkowbacteria bacterium]
MITVDKEKCIGCGACGATCPDVFELAADGKAQTKDGADQGLPCVADAKAGCPVGAIAVE